MDAVLEVDMSELKQALSLSDPNCASEVHEVIEENNDVMTITTYKAPLAVAVQQGKMDMVKVLIDAGADVGFYVYENYTPLVAAAENNHVNIVKYLLEQGDLDAQRIDKALIAAEAQENQQIIALLKNRGANLLTIDINEDRPGEGTVLMYAARQGNIELVKKFVSQGADVNIDSPGTGTALMVATRAGALPVVKYLLTQGAEIDADSRGVGTALIVAVLGQNLPLIKYLVSQGANVDQASYGVGTALSIAVYKEDFRIVNYLLSKGANVNAKAEGVEAPLWIARRSGNQQLIKKLLDAGAQNKNADKPLQGADKDTGYQDYDCHRLIEAIRKRSINEIQALLEKADPNCMHYSDDSQGIDDNDEYPPFIIRKSRTPLVAAARRGDVEIGKLLLSSGADVNLYAEGDESPLMAAAAYGHLSFVKLLVDNGADVNMNAEGVGPQKFYLYVAEKGHVPTLTEFMSSGRKAHIGKAGEGTALQVAERNGHRATVDYLRSRGAKK